MVLPAQQRRPEAAALSSIAVLAMVGVVVAFIKTLLFPDLNGVAGFFLLALVVVTVGGLLFVRFVVWPLASQPAAASADHYAEAFITNFQSLDDNLRSARNETEVIERLQESLNTLDLPGLVELHVIGGLTDDLNLVGANRPLPPEHVTSSPWEPLATQSGETLTFADTSDPSACPHLAKRLTQPSSGVSIPLIAQDGILGVLQAAGPVDSPPTNTAVIILEALASRAALHIALQRSASEAWRAHLDQTTSLPHVDDVTRQIARHLEDGVAMQVGHVSITDIDHYEAVNGTPMTNRALRWVATVLLNNFAPGTTIGTDGLGNFIIGVSVYSDAHAELPMSQRFENVQQTLRSENETIEPFDVTVGFANSDDGNQHRSVDELIAHARASASTTA